jgi:hypothetical protein
VWVLLSVGRWETMTVAQLVAWSVAPKVAAMAACWAAHSAVSWADSKAVPSVNLWVVLLDYWLAARLVPRMVELLDSRMVAASAR